MDKIEKLVEIIEKQGETMEYIVEALYEIVEVLDQSQKQPEGVSYVNSNPEGTVIPESTTTHTEPEKQEEWKRELDDLLEDYWGYPDQGTEEAFIRGEMGVFKLVSQLLSERTFTKEELKRISKRVNEYDKDSYEDELDCEIVEKIDNLLKEEE